MKTFSAFVVLTLALVATASADVRGLYFRDHVGSSFRHGRDYRHHDRYFGSYGLIFQPGYFADSYYRGGYDDYDVRTVVVRERAPEVPRASTYAPTFSPGGWKTKPWYRSRPQVVTAPNTLSDARSAEQLQSIYGAQGASLAR